MRLRAAVNPVDYKLRAHGTIGGSLPASSCHGAGVVEGTGPAVTRFTGGDEVYFVDGGYGRTPGTYQEVKIIDERLLARKPERLSFVEAAAAPLVTITAWEALRGRDTYLRSSNDSNRIADPVVERLGCARIRTRGEASPSDRARTAAERSC